MPSPHPQPTALAKLKGADKHDPQRYRARAKEPKPVLGIGTAPAQLSESAVAIWIELQDDFAPGVLTRQDRRMFGVLCELFAEHDKSPADMTGARLSVMNSIQAQFGMTPSSRTKVSTVEIEDDKPENPFAKFAPNLRAVS